MFETKIQECKLFLQKWIKGNPKIAIILGSGLGELINHVSIMEEIPYSKIPHFLDASVKGHKGALIYATYHGIEIVILSGRTHFYEGYSMQTITFPIRVLHALGINKLILSNAAGGLNPSFKIGDIMIIKDHINFFMDNPLIAINDDTKNSRFTSMNEPYSHRIINIATQIAQKERFYLQKGVYVGVSGPYYGTISESKAFFILGGDAVGMSTIPENIVAQHLKIEVFALSVITDLAVIGSCEEVSHEEVLQAAAIATPTMIKLIYELVPQL